MIVRLLLILAACAAMSDSGSASDLVLLHAAGSLRSALIDVINAFEATSGTRVQAKFGAPGLLEDEIAGGAKAEVFASANMEHSEALAAARRSGPVVRFARNCLCALVRPGLTVDTASLLDRMLDPNVKLGTSTPRADPSGDYAWEMFRKADAIRPGAFAVLEQKALKLTGGPSGPEAPAGRTIYGVLLAQGGADIFLTYCTNALAARHEEPAYRIVALPDTLAVAADYGLTVMSDASLDAYRFAMFILSVQGQRILASHGFLVPNLTQ